MPVALFAVILIAFVVVGVVVVRRTQRRAVVARLPIVAGERVLLAEEGLKVSTDFVGPQLAVEGGSPIACVRS